MSELDEIKTQYERGELDFIKKDLQHFIIYHKTKILEYKKFLRSRYSDNEIQDDLAIKLFILKERSINPRAEITDQIKEIEKEKWIRGVKTGNSPDPIQVATEWARLYSEGWRSHRLTSIIFVFEQEKDKYASLLQ